MELRNCIRCGKVFGSIGGRVCPACLDSEEADYQRIKEYLTRKPKAKIFEVVEATEVSEPQVVEFIRGGRLIAEGLGEALTISCERCGRPISQGRFCADCTATLGKEITGTQRALADKLYEQDKAANRTNMHIANYHRKRSGGGSGGSK